MHKVPVTGRVRNTPSHQCVNIVILFQHTQETIVDWKLLVQFGMGWLDDFI
jgi:hypothetical protein